MRTETKNKLVKKVVTVYVSEDGKEFNSESECIMYEERIRRSCLETIHECKEADNFPPFDGCENMECNSYRWFRPENKEQVSMLNYCIEQKDKIGDSCIGKWVCIEFDYRGTPYWSSTLECCIEYAKDLLGKLGYNITVTPRS